MNNRHKPYQKNNKIINRRKMVTPLGEIDDETWKAAHESHYWGPFLAKSMIINNNNNNG